MFAAELGTTFYKFCSNKLVTLILYTDAGAVEVEKVGKNPTKSTPLEVWAHFSSGGGKFSGLICRGDSNTEVKNGSAWARPADCGF